MTIVIAIVLGFAGGLSFGLMWRQEEADAMEAELAKLRQERRDRLDIFRTEQRQDWVN